jgi:hypothetical protein
LAAVEKQLEMRARLRAELDALAGQPPLELGALHRSIVHKIVYLGKPEYKPLHPRAEIVHRRIGCLNK